MLIKKMLYILTCLILAFSVICCDGNEKLEGKDLEQDAVPTSQPVPAKSEDATALSGVTESAITNTNKQTSGNHNSLAPIEKIPAIEAPATQTPAAMEIPAMEISAPLNADERYAVFNNTLFIGDSRTEGFKLYSGVTNASYFCAKSLSVDKIVNCSKVAVGNQMLTMQEMLDSGTWDKIIISIGLNELGWNYIDDFINQYKQLVEIVQQKQPDAKIYIQALLPVTAEKSATHKYNNNAQIYWYNINIQEMAEEMGLMYIDASLAIVNTDGNLMTEASSDGIHLNKQYCQKWAEYLSTLL